MKVCKNPNCNIELINRQKNYCSKACMNSHRWMNPKFRESMSAALSARVNDPNSNCGLSKRWADPEFRNMMKDVLSHNGTNTMNGLWQDLEFRNSMKELITKLSNDPNSGCGFKSLWRADYERMYDNLKSRNFNIEYLLGEKNKLEQYFDELTPVEVEYVSGSFWQTLSDNSRITPDFKVKDTKLIIELFGDYWHNRQYVHQIHNIGPDERERIEKWKSIGYSCLVIWESDLYNNTGFELLRMKNFLNNTVIHHMTSVDSSVKCGVDCIFWYFCNVCPEVEIGNRCAIGSGVYIGRKTIIGDDVRIQDKAHITDHMKIGNRVFVGPCVTTMNDRYPKVNNPDYVPEPPEFDDDCSIGAGAIILPGIKVGKRAVVSAGCLVTKNVPDDCTAAGNPCKIIHRYTDSLYPPISSTMKDILSK